MICLRYSPTKAKQWRSHAPTVRWAKSVGVDLKQVVMVAQPVERVTRVFNNEYLTFRTVDGGEMNAWMYTRMFDIIVPEWKREDFL